MFYILEAFILASALSIDAFIVSFAYGSNKIKIPQFSIQVINLICGAITGLSLMAGSILKQYIPGWLTLGISFTILFALGIIKLLDGLTKSFIRKHTFYNKEVKFSLFNFRFILNLYADPEKADADSSKIISPKEAASLAIALSLDGIAAGFSAALANVNGWALFISSLITNMAAVILGCYIGNKVARKLSFNLSWAGGIILMVLAVLKLL